jgi:hypothetical protein
VRRPLSPQQLAVAEAERICRVRQRTGWGPRLIAGETGHPQAPSRAACSAPACRVPRPPCEAPRRYEWLCPGDFLHVDTKRFAGFTGLAPAVTGDPQRTSRERAMRVGYEWVH